jgi:hypothetical protein
MLFGAVAFCTIPPYATLHATPAGRAFSEKVANARKFAVIAPLPEMVTIVFGEVRFVSDRLSVYDQLLNTNAADAIALV